jgi:hypothetical protein
MWSAIEFGLVVYVVFAATIICFGLATRGIDIIDNVTPFYSRTKILKMAFLWPFSVVYCLFLGVTK